jgi:uncharacterized DUF497 family protein
MDFEWDETKNLANQKKHGLDFLEATECFFDPDGIELIDEKHSETEKRLYWVESQKKDESLRSGTQSEEMQFELLV